MRFRRPSYLHVRPAEPGSARLRDVRVRWAHPWVLVLALRAILRWSGFLRPLCSHCGGAGRLVKSQLFRRERCFVCDGSGLEPAPGIRRARWARRSVALQQWIAARCDVGADIPGGGAA